MAPGSPNDWDGYRHPDPARGRPDENLRRRVGPPGRPQGRVGRPAAGAVGPAHGAERERQEHPAGRPVRAAGARRRAGVGRRRRPAQGRVGDDAEGAGGVPAADHRVRVPGVQPVPGPVGPAAVGDRAQLGRVRRRGRGAAAGRRDARQARAGPEPAQAAGPALRRRETAGGHRPGAGQGPVVRVRRRADECARLGERAEGDRAAPGRRPRPAGEHPGRLPRPPAAAVRRRVLLPGRRSARHTLQDCPPQEVCP